MKSAELEKGADDPTSLVNCPEVAPTICTALQIAVFHQIQRLGVLAKVAIGHSTGEIAAAYASGLLNLESTLAIAYYYGFVTRNCLNGSMATATLGPEEIQSYLREGVVVACENSPSSTTLSGDSDILQEVLSSIKKLQPNASTRLVHTNAAYHSRKYSSDTTVVPTSLP